MHPRDGERPSPAPSGPASFLVGLLRLAGFEFWMVGWTPAYIGWVVASRNLVPDWPALLLLTAVAPGLTGSTFVFNNLVDRQADVANPRKAFSLLVQGRLSPRGAGLSYLLLLISALALAGVAGRVLAATPTWQPLLLVALCAGLALAYSSPRHGLKGVGGADLAINAGAIGLLLPLAGWSLVKPAWEFPPLYLASIACYLGALYAPTTVADFHADKVVATRSLAVRYGIRRTLLIGFALLLTGAGLLALAGLVEQPPWNHRLLWATGWLLPLEVVAYYHYFWPPRDSSAPSYGAIWKGCVVVGSLCAAATLTFLLLFVAWG